MKSRLDDALRQFIAKEYDSSSTPFALDAERRKSTFKLEINTVTDQKTVEKLRNEEIVGFEVRKRDTNVPEYQSSGKSLGANSDGNVTIRYTSSDVFSALGTTKDEILEKVEQEEYPLAELVDDEPSRANAIVETPTGSNHRINMTKDEIRMEKIINSGDLEYDSDGRVKVDKIGEFSRKLLNQKLQKLGARSLPLQSLLS